MFIFFNKLHHQGARYPPELENLNKEMHSVRQCTLIMELFLIFLNFYFP